MAFPKLRFTAAEISGFAKAGVILVTKMARRKRGFFIKL
jgi:hypothetical protein